jgi:hypothetical protein
MKPKNASKLIKEFVSNHCSFYDLYTLRWLGSKASIRQICDQNIYSILLLLGYKETASVAGHGVGTQDILKAFSSATQCQLVTPIVPS